MLMERQSSMHSSFLCKQNVFSREGASNTTTSWEKKYHWASSKQLGLSAPRGLICTMQPTCALRMCDISTPDANDDCIADKNTDAHSSSSTGFIKFNESCAMKNWIQSKILSTVEGQGNGTTWLKYCLNSLATVGHMNCFSTFMTCGSGQQLVLQRTVPTFLSAWRWRADLSHPITGEFATRHWHCLTCSDSSVTPLSFSRSHHTSGRCLITSGCKMKPKKRCGPKCTGIPCGVSDKW